MDIAIIQSTLGTFKLGKQFQTTQWCSNIARKFETLIGQEKNLIIERYGKCTTIVSKLSNVIKKNERSSCMIVNLLTRKIM